MGVRGGVLVEACAGAEVEAEAGPDAARSPLPLLQVGPGGPHRGVVGHVVVGREQLHLLPSHTHTGNTHVKHTVNTHTCIINTHTHGNQTR